MPQFTTRVVLEDGTEDDYDALHEAMKKAGFSRLILSDSGTWYRMPWAEYNSDGSLTKAQVLDAAKRAAEVTGNSFQVLVTESAGRTWLNLKQAK